MLAFSCDFGGNDDVWVQEKEDEVGIVRRRQGKPEEDEERAEEGTGGSSWTDQLSDLPSREGREDRGNEADQHDPLLGKGRCRSIQEAEGVRQGRKQEVPLLLRHRTQLHRARRQAFRHDGRYVGRPQAGRSVREDRILVLLQEEAVGRSLVRPQGGLEKG